MDTSPKNGHGHIPAGLQMGTDGVCGGLMGLLLPGLVPGHGKKQGEDGFALQTDGLPGDAQGGHLAGGGLGGRQHRTGPQHPHRLQRQQLRVAWAHPTP